MNTEKIKVKIIREEIIIITKSMLAKISTPSSTQYPTIDIEGKTYMVMSWKSHPSKTFNKNEDFSEPDYEICLRALNEWELS